MTVETRDDVAADEPGLVRRRTRRLNYIERHAAVGAPELIDTGIRTIHRCGRRSSRNVAHVLHQHAQTTATGEKDRNRNPHPGHAAHASSAWVIDRRAVSPRHRRTVERSSRVSASCSLSVGKTHRLSVLSRTLAQPIAARATKPHFLWHRRAALRTNNRAVLIGPARILLRLHDQVS